MCINALCQTYTLAHTEDTHHRGWMLCGPNPPLNSLHVFLMKADCVFAKFKLRRSFFILGEGQIFILLPQPSNSIPHHGIVSYLCTEAIFIFYFRERGRDGER